MSSETLPQSPPAEDLKDLGFGSRLAQESRVRLLNRDGTFNVKRRGLSYFRSLSLYHSLITMSWPRFYSMLVLFYIGVNVFFAGAYLACGPDALAGPHLTLSHGAFLDAFFFSVQTLATIGYGAITPHGLAANLLVTAEAFFGLLGFSIATGISYARFSRPSARIIFSNQAVMAPFRGGNAFQFRIANARTNHLLDVQARVLFSRMERTGGKTARKFDMLALERDRVVFLPLHWTIVHAIGETSPLRGVTAEELRAKDAEFLILLTATDETFSQIVHARSSYKPHEIVFGARFADVFEETTAGVVSIDLGRLHSIEPAGPM
jgi:inward rectifier potassium channel